MKNKFIIKLNPGVFRFIYSALLAVVLGAVFLFSTSFLTNKILGEIDIQYEEACDKVIEGYSKNYELIIENYFSCLKTYINTDLFPYTSGPDIQKYLIESKYKNHKDFVDVFYVDEDGIGYSQNGLKYAVQNRDYYKEIMKYGKATYISGLCKSKIDYGDVIILARAVTNVYGKVRGVLAASVKGDSFQKVLSETVIINSGRVSLIDQYGYFISNPNNALIGQSFSPSAQNSNFISSIEIANSPQGTFRTIDYSGTEVFLMSKDIKNTTWKLCVSIPMNIKNELVEKQNHYKTMILILSIIIILILIVMEFKLMDYFQKKKVIDTIYDSLTQLWTRQKFEDEVTKIMDKKKNAIYLLIDADIKGFKFINQNYGENTADRVIVYYAQLIEKMAQNFHCFVGRGYADHIYIFTKVTSVITAQTIFHIAAKEVVKEIKNFDFPFTPKFGVAFKTPDEKYDDVTIQKLIGYASFAKSTIKENSQEIFAVFDSKLLDKVIEEQNIENHMEQAIINNEFFVMYQPKISLSTNKIVGAEALVRWNHPEYGLLPPYKFIPIFEKNGFITKLDFYVYDQVFKFLNNRLENNLPVIPISVNMSRNHSKPAVFIEEIMRLFNKYSIPPSLIQVEILESSYMDNSNLEETTNKLHELGFTVAMDDFGSGESSLNMLTKIPIDVIKFDRQFLLSSTGNNGEIDLKSQGFIKLLIQLSKHLEKQTIFEGVETVEQRDFLKSIDCDQVQGYFYSKPLNIEDFVKYIQENS